jgi:hypothetical protein
MKILCTSIPLLLVALCLAGAGEASAATFRMDVELIPEIGLRSNVSVLPPPPKITLQVSSDYGNDLSIQGNLLNQTSTTINIQAIFEAIMLVAAVEFNASASAVSMTAHDLMYGREEPGCNPVQSIGGNSSRFKLSCQIDSAGTILVHGYVNK